MTSRKLQGSINRRAPGSVNFVLALAYHFWLNLPAAFTQPGARLLVEPCISYEVRKLFMLRPFAKFGLFDFPPYYGRHMWVLLLLYVICNFALAPIKLIKEREKTSSNNQ